MTFIDRLSRRLGAFPVELPAALLAAGAVLFWLLIVPGSRLGPLTGALASEAARLLFASAGAALAFALTWAGLRALEPRRRVAADMPQFRKADLHPDAPRRRPIRADREFGAPEFDSFGAEFSPRLTASAAVPLPSFLQPSLSRGGDGEPIRFVDDIVRDVPDGVVVAREPVWFRPRAIEDGDEQWEEADWEEANDDVPAPEPDLETDESIEPGPPPPERPSTDESVAKLMARLESGLARRGGAPVRPIRDEHARASLRAVADDLNAIFPADFSPKARAAQ